LNTSGCAVAPSLEHLHRISSVTGELSLSKLLRRFIHNIDVPDGFFFPRITEDQKERAVWLDTLPLSVADKFTLSLVPISSKVPSLQTAWEHWAKNLSQGKTSTLRQHAYGGGTQNLQQVEDTCRYYSAYAWLSYRLPEFFPDIAVAQNLSRDASERVDSILRAHNAASRGRSKKFK
ncbi:MAG: SUV3 C-terminal domain-containing protein, partial [Janthinobacterium sp.]